MVPEKTIWTIGHSTRSFGELVEALRSFGIETLADIRSYPSSRRNPQFGADYLAANLPAEGIKYMRIPELGGRRPQNPDSTNMQWRHPAFRAYADYMETEGFRKGIEILAAEASQRRTAFMCAEAVWWKCHRSLVSDYLKSEGWTVVHITGPGKGGEHPYTAAARITDGKLSYKSLL